MTTEANKSPRSHGGARPGAGRPKGTGRFREPTRAIRVPESSVTYIQEMLRDYSNVIELESKRSKSNLPLYSSKVAAGFPSPAEDHIEETLDLNEYMVHHPESSFMLRVEGESMRDAGILPNDILVVDRSLTPTHNKIVIAAIDGELTVKRLFHRGGLIKLMPDNPDYGEIELKDEADLVIWGVVVGSFRRFQTF